MDVYINQLVKYKLSNMEIHPNNPIKKTKVGEQHIGFCVEIYITNLKYMQFHEEQKETIRKGDTEDM